MARTADINLSLILSGCRQGNRNSQRILYEHYFGYGLKIVSRYTKNREEAEEVFNNAFLKVFRKLDTYNAQYPFRVWLHRIMVNTAIDYYRSQQNKLKFDALETAEEPTTPSAPLPIIREGEDMLPILQELPPTYRIVFNLAVMEGYHHNEIAELLGITASTSRSNLTRAKEKLKRILLKKRVEQQAVKEIKNRR